MFRRSVALMVGGGLGVVGGCVYAKPKDTPDYLMPFYLTTMRRRFNHYAQTIKDGKRCMTSEDFIRSLLCAKKPNQEIPPNVSRDLDGLFRNVDANGDGVLSFAEFSLFMLFLTNSRRKFELAFQMFDTNESGTVDVEEFKEICSCLNNDSTVRFNFNGGITETFFGEDYSRQLGMNEFWSFVDSLRIAVWKAEFTQYDPNDTGSIKPEEFASLVTDSMLGSHLPFYIVDNIRKMKANPRFAQKEINFPIWESFNRLMINSPQVGRAIQTYTNANIPLRKEDFLRAIKVAVKDDLGKSMAEEVDLIFAIFDRDGDGNLEYDEFLSVARNKFNFNAQNHKNTEDAIPAFKLFEECLTRAWYI